MNQVRFCCEAPEAEEVYLVGDFNDWQPKATRMRRVPNQKHRFVTRMQLEPGIYQFKYWVDGQWMCDPAHERVPNDQGTQNSVIEVT